MLSVKVGDVVKTKSGGIYIAEQVDGESVTAQRAMRRPWFGTVVIQLDTIAEVGVPIPKRTRMMVGFDGIPHCWAYATEHDTWNGFLMPYADEDNARAWIQRYNESEGREVYRMEHGAIVYQDEGYTNRIELQDVETEDGTKRLYDIGAGCGWEVVTEKTYRTTNLDDPMSLDNVEPNDVVTLSQLLGNDDTAAIDAVSHLQVGESVTIGGWSQPKFKIARVA